MAIPRKPTKNVDEFISTAKVKEKQQGNESSSYEAPKVKKLLIELPYDLWKALKMKALTEDKSLKDIILDSLKETANKE